LLCFGLFGSQEERAQRRFCDYFLDVFGSQEERAKCRWADNQKASDMPNWERFCCFGVCRCHHLFSISHHFCCLSLPPPAVAFCIFHLSHFTYEQLV
jgi:hypothetical protein